MGCSETGNGSSRKRAAHKGEPQPVAEFYGIWMAAMFPADPDPFDSEFPSLS